MRRVPVLIALACIAASVPATAFAQTLGIEAGMTVASLMPGIRWSTGVGFEAGGLLSWPATKNVDFQVRPMFVKKRSSVSIGDRDSQIRSTLSIDYIEVGLLLRRPFTQSGAVRPAIFGGGFFSGVARARSTSEIGSAVAVEDARDLVARMDAGFVLGLEIEFFRDEHAVTGTATPRSTDRALVVSMRFDLGAKDLARDYPNETFGGTRSFSITAGLRWIR